jgi:hypothetical protein
MKKYLICILVILFNFLVLYGQTPSGVYRPIYYDPFMNQRLLYPHKQYVPPSDPYYRGYVLMNTDTIYCFVKNDNNFENATTINYKLTETGSVHTVDIEDIKEVFDNTYVYEKITYENFDYLVRVLIRGTVSLYEISTETESSFGTIYHSVFFVKRSDTLFRIKKKSYKKDLKSVLTNHPETTKKIDNLHYRDIDAFIQALVNNYNAWYLEENKAK